MISPETEGAEVAPNEINLGGNDFETSPLVFNAIDLPRTRRYTPCYLLLAVSLISTAIWRIGSETAEVSKLTALDLHNACGRKLSWSADRHLCVAAKGAYNGAEVTTQPCGSLGFQDEWIFTKRGKNITRMRLATAPHLCMSPMSGPKIFPGSKLLLQWCSDTDHHQHFSEVNGTIRWQKRANLCMDVQYDKDAANTPLQLWHCTGAKVQMFDQWPCKDRCFRQIHFTRHPGMCLTTAGWHLKEGVDLGLSPCLESHWGASQFKFSTSGGKLQLALNHELCAEADGSGLRIAKCAENHPKQDFMLNYSLIVGRGSDPSCIMAKPSKALKLAKSCRSEPEVEALTSGCEEIIHPHIKVSDDDATGCPRQIRWSSYPSLCIGTMAWHVGHGQNIVLSACEDHKMAGPRQHWVFTTKGKIQLASSPSYCLEVTKQLYESYFPISSQADGAHLQLSQCIDGDEAQQFTMGPDNIIRQGDKCVDVEWRIPLPYSRLVLTECGGEQQFYRDVCKNEEHAVPPHRKGSFIVVGDWGWDHLVHGNVPKATCQEAIGARMAQMMDELGDVKFIINVGDSFYPDGLTSKSDPRWDIQWRERYPGVVRSVPWYSVYGNHDTHHDPGWCHSGVGSQINGNLHDYGTFYMPHYSWHIEHDDLNVEVLGLDLNKFVDGWNATRPVSELELSDCQYSPCPDECRENAELRAEEAFNLMSTRLNKSQKSNLLVFSHYPTDYLQSVPDFVNQLRPHGKRTIAYFSGHRHNTDQTTTLRTGPHDWLVGGGGGWSCDGIEQGFVVGIIDNDFQLKTHPVLVNPWMCCPDLPKENNIKLLKRMKRLRLKLK